MKAHVRPPWAWSRRPLKPLEPARGDGSGGRPCLVHLVRKANGISAFSEFAGAYRSHPAGIEHELVLAMKGFSSPADASPYLEEIEDLELSSLFFPDRGYDIGVYLACAARLRRDRYCFVNSFARPEVDGWLAMLDAALERPGVGQVGATGSWASHHSFWMYSLGLSSAYRGLMPAPLVARKLLMGIESERDGKERRSVLDLVRARLRTLVRLPEELMGFAPFPNPFLRTNAFMISHATLRELGMFVVRNKMDAYSVESGREGITSQLRRLGLTSLVVDRFGAVYGPDRWHLSRTLWQGEQEGLLVADNQTALYSDGDAARRRLLSTFSWGSSADPSLSSARSRS
jgi:hypothetical protein